MRRPVICAAAAVAGLATVIAGCSSSNSTSAGSTGTSSASPAASVASQAPSSSGTASAGGGLASVNALYQQYLVRPTSIPESAPLTSKPAPGKVIDWLDCGLPDCENLLPFAQKAASYFQFKLQVISAGFTPQTIKAAFDEVVKNHPDGVWASADNTALFATELATLHKEGIPYVEYTDQNPVGNGVSGMIIPNQVFVEQGKVSAYAAIHEKGTQLDALTIQISGAAAPLQETESFESQITASCAQCKVSAIEFPETELGTAAIPNGVIAYLKGHPDINLIECPYYEVTEGVVPLLGPAGLSSVATVSNMEGPIYNDVKSGKTIAVASPWPEWIYMSMDMFARLFTNQSIAPSTQDPASVHFWILDSSDIPSDAANTYFALTQNYDAQFRTLWGT
jgi:ribose transport system substrate-binding protein